MLIRTKRVKVRAAESMRTSLACHASPLVSFTPFPLFTPAPRYCFCVYKTREGAEKAMTVLEGREVKDHPGRRVSGRQAGVGQGGMTGLRPAPEGPRLKGAHTIPQRHSVLGTGTGSVLPSPAW